MTPREKLMAARVMMCERAPYFRSTLWALIPAETAGLGTFGVTERGYLMYDPEKAREWTVEQIAAVLMHEVGHVLRDHARRGRALGADHQLWNIAGDAEINDDLDQHWKLPDSPVLPEGLGAERGLTAEVYYNRLRQQQGQGQGQQGQGQQGQGQQGQGTGDDGDGQGDDCGCGQPGGLPKGWKCGSGANNPFDSEPGKDGEGRSEADLGRVRAQAAREIQAAAERGRGTVPAGWVRWAGEQLKPPRIPWRQKLARFARQALSDKAGLADYTYSRPSRRQAGFGWGTQSPILPAMRGPKPRAAVALDTSGSMGGKELADALAEAAGVLLATGTEVTFLSCDADVHAMGKVRDWRQLAGLVKGGGGTDFAPVFEALERSPGARPDVLVYITDGCGPAPAQPPRGMGVIWLLVGPYRQRPSSHSGGTCTWGEVVELVADDEEPRIQ